MESNENTNEEVEGMEMDEDLDMEQSFEEMFESSMQELNVGDVVLGTIVQVTDDHVVVDVGYKSEGVIPLYEFKDEEGKIDIKVGDEVDVLFERRENDSGLIGLSKEKADRQKIWGSLEEGAVVEGKIVGRIKGGLTVDIGINAFLPGSQVDLRP
ncbi:MAG: S1 RNA-binding domain-containing protein, partial [Desulfuromonadales bacterium]|nr:S1 RNA-binding domain-containing protein [Desulfuromonadales bacterium]